MKSFNGAPGAWWADNPAYGDEAEQAIRAYQEGYRCETCDRLIWVDCLHEDGGIREVLDPNTEEPDYWYLRCGGRWWEERTHEDP